MGDARISASRVRKGQKSKSTADVLGRGDRGEDPVDLVISPGFTTAPY
jgi:hypothetical protein